MVSKHVLITKEKESLTMNIEEAYKTLQAIVSKREKEIGATLESIARNLKDDPGLDWTTIKEEERRIKPTVQDYRYYAVRRVATPGRFSCGGDRTLCRRRSVKQQNNSNDVSNGSITLKSHPRVVNDLEETVQHVVAEMLAQRFPKQRHLLNVLGRRVQNKNIRWSQRRVAVGKPKATTTEANVTIKPEPLDDADIILGVCPECAPLASRIETIRPHSDAPHKRRQRDRVLADVAAALERLSGPHQRVNVYLFDDFLSDAKDADGGSGRLLASELLERFGADHIRIFSPNLKEYVVRTNAALASCTTSTRWLTTGVGCWHRFHDRWEAVIRETGGLDVVFADCFGGFERGAGRWVADAVRRRLFRADPSPLTATATSPSGVLVSLSWAVSTLPLRLQRQQRSDGSRSGRTAAACALQILEDLARCFGDDDDTPYVHKLAAQEAFGVTMHWFVVNVRPREWATAAHGWRPRLLYTDE